MLWTAILAVLEPKSLALERSVAWKVTQALQKGLPFTISDNERTLGTVRGVVPILQPTVAEVEGTPAVLLYLRAVIDVAPSFDANLDSKTTLSLKDTQGALTASLAVCQSDAIPLSLVLVSPELSGLLTPQDDIALRNTVSRTANAHWSVEPINATTTHLHLTTTGHIVSGAEIRAGAAQKAQLVIANGAISSVPQVFPLVTFGFNKWRSAGKINIFPNDSGSGSSCTLSCTSGHSGACTDCQSGAGSSCTDSCDSCSSCGTCSSCSSCSSCDACDSCGGCS
jgi:hypothetical protein